jgi:hypothetical protein
MEVLCVVIVPVFAVMAWGVYVLVTMAIRDEALLVEKANAEALRLAREHVAAESFDEAGLRDALKGTLPRSLYERVVFDTLFETLRGR